MYIRTYMCAVLYVIRHGLFSVYICLLILYVRTYNVTMSYVCVCICYKWLGVGGWLSRLAQLVKQ